MTECNPVLTFVRSLAFNVLFYLNTLFWLIVGIPTFVMPAQTLGTGLLAVRRCAKG